jgi:hypothetical protein
MEFNDGYAAKLDAQEHQVERKLLWEFNESVAPKALMQHDATGTHF